MLAEQLQGGGVSAAAGGGSVGTSAIGGARMSDAERVCVLEKQVAAPQPLTALSITLRSLLRTHAGGRLSPLHSV